MNERNRHEMVENGYGTLVLLVGPSGSGKDSVLNFARSKFKGDPRVLFVRRCITRSNSDPSEDHESMSVAAFQRAEMLGEFVISWGAHGLYYGLPATMLAHLECGGVAIANGSRKTIPVLRAQFPNFEAVNLTVDPAILAERLAKRGRETVEEIQKRIDRSEKLKNEDLFDDRTHHIDNSGNLASAGTAFTDLIERCVERTNFVVA